MKWVSRSSQQKLKMPTTQVYHMLDDQMTLVVRAWGSQEHNQKLMDEVSHFMSSAQADLDVTSPFDFRENLSNLANKTRISLLLAHDLFYKTENKNDFAVGFEVAVLFRIKNELAWSSVGRFSMQKINSTYFQTLYASGSDRDDETLLPTELLGAEKEVEINSGSMLINAHTHILLSSVCGGELLFKANNDSQASIVPSNNSMTYWYSLVSPD